jgi:DNA replication protein DnaC
MEHIGNIMPEVIETMGRLTRVESATTAPIEKPSAFSWDFDTMGDPALSEMLLAKRTRSVGICGTGNLPAGCLWSGPAGPGKTHLARKISSWFRRNLLGCLRPDNEEGEEWRMGGGFVSWRKLTDQLRSGEYGRFIDISTDWFVALDDIGAGHETAFVTSKLDQFFDSRLKKWTVITGNLSLQQIKDRMDARIASRMIRNGSVVVDVNVVDFNLRKRAA